jgi:autotransporter-associated beta strand protein
MNVTNNLTLTILRPLNVNGNLVKEGAGTLALGGTLTFNGETQSATPTAGQNLLTVRGGAIMPLATNAFDGLAITFTNNASIKLDATTADADLLGYGIVNVKETTAPIALAANQASIPVTVTPPEGNLSRFSVAICTIGSASAANLPETTFSVANVSHYRCRRVVKRTNADGTVTYLAPFFNRGFTIDFR